MCSINRWNIESEVQLSGILMESFRIDGLSAGDMNRLE